ncbi:hypothetical protein AB5J52_22575 [Streptomyces sp. R39]|uniref:VCBS repeat-containing protein n=1 Tax=Streptomyces sp. R39 TaxID=3238631 RepID=A0AB39R4H3_9ACTN
MMVHRPERPRWGVVSHSWGHGRAERTRRPNGASTIYLGQDGKWHGRKTVGVRDVGKPEVPVGDLDGDGTGDLLGRDKAGNLYRWYGNGRGGFGARVQIGSGWGVYKALY